MTRTFLHSFDPPADSPVTDATVDLTVADIEDTGIREVLQTPGTAYGAWFIPDALLTPTGAGTPFVRRPRSLPVLPFDKRRGRCEVHHHQPAQVPAPAAALPPLSVNRPRGGPVAPSRPGRDRAAPSPPGSQTPVWRPLGSFSDTSSFVRPPAVAMRARNSEIDVSTPSESAFRVGSMSDW